jgi:predicted dehydrogenase
MTKPLRVGLIGCGFFATNHLHAWAEMPDVVVAAVCDIDASKAAAAAKTFDVKASYDDAAEMLAQQTLDFVDIVTTMASHRSLVELCAGKGLPVIVQKPFAPSYADCLAMVSACDKAGVPLMVHENFRFQAPMRRVKAVLDSGAIGSPLWARLSFRTGYDVKAGQPYLFEEEKFIVLDLGIHVLDLARFFLGEVETLYARHQKVDTRVRGEDMATLLIGHCNGATAVVDITYESRRLPDTFPQTLVSIEGTKGAVELKAGSILAVSSEGRLSEINVATPLRAWTSEPWHIAQDSVFETQSHFVDCLRRGLPSETRGADNLKTFALVDAAYESARTQRVVRLEAGREGEARDHHQLSRCREAN